MIGVKKGSVQMIVSAMQDGMANRIADYGCAMKRKLRRVRAATQ